MAKEYSFSSSHHENAPSDNIATTNSFANNFTECGCQRNGGISHGSHQQQQQQSAVRRRTSSNISSIRNTMYLVIMMLVFVSHFTCFVSAWPILNQRRTYNYAPASLVIPSDYDLDINQWALASQPMGAAAAVPPAYFDLPSMTQQEEDEYDDQLFEDDPEEMYQMPQIPMFGPILDPEAEEELELEDLKHQQPYVYDKRRPSKGKGTQSPASSLPLTTPMSTEAALPHASSTTTASASILSSSSSDSKKPAHPVSPAVVVGKAGQKEIAMLRPPSSKSVHYNGIQLDEQEEPKISVAQRSPSNEKPSAYDRLRKYLSLDDALKKEYQLRRTNASSRHAKRDSGSSIITESDNLTGQLNSLKKKMD